MTLTELAERDFRKAKINLENAKKKPNVPQAELEHLSELCVLRQHILQIVKERTDGK